MGWARRIIPPGWALLAVLASLLLHRELPITRLIFPPLNLLGWASVAAGCVLAGAGFRAFTRAGTPVRPFERSTALVTAGIYRHTRNPMYLGLVLLLCGVAWICGTLGAFLPLPLLVWLLQSGYIRGEERFLEELFGDDYRRYRSRVRRWV